MNRPRRTNPVILTHGSLIASLIFAVPESMRELMCQPPPVCGHRVGILIKLCNTILVLFQFLIEIYYILDSFKIGGATPSPGLKSAGKYVMKFA
ncbi:MAG: hypothetical protein A4E66_01314 [Syntrophus sp. PtaB.Bin001]|nr:MAG: hypothetical protein A4E66_01314 [Syntrophus sp. PtaB.Bin001]